MIRLLTDHDRKIIMEYLERHEIETSFLYGNIVEFGIDNRKDMRRCGDYYGFFEGDTLRGILPFYNLGSCIPHFETKDAVPQFAELMKNRNFEFLLGMEKIIKPLYEEIKGCKQVVSFSESSYMINRDFKPFVLDGVTFINADKSYDDNLIDFIVEANFKGFGHTADREDIKKSLIQRGSEEEFIIAVKNGKMVSQACVQTYTPKINQIGSVYTTEDERGKGYCKAVVSEICRRVIEKGKVPTLSVRKNNTPAYRAYTSLGFKPYDDYLLIEFK